MIYLTAQRNRATVPQEARNIFEEFHRESWTEDDRKSLSSIYPNLSVGDGGFEGGPELEINMDAFFQKWSQLDQGASMGTAEEMEGLSSGGGSTISRQTTEGGMSGMEEVMGNIMDVEGQGKGKQPER
jgi:hypothetical protein